ncbi:transcription elongation factor 1 [Monosporozyma servazzii]
MGKRKKSSTGPAKRVTQKLDTKFNCLFCNHDKSVSCTLDKKNSIGTLSCKICGQSFQTRINSLSQPVDVYSDWFDAVEEVNAEHADVNSDSEGSSSDYESDSDDDDSQNTSTRVKSGSARVVVDSDEEDEEVDDERHRVGARNVVDSDEDDE